MLGDFRGCEPLRRHSKWLHLSQRKWISLAVHHDECEHRVNDLVARGQLPDRRAQEFCWAVMHEIPVYTCGDGTLKMTWIAGVTQDRAPAQRERSAQGACNGDAVMIGKGVGE